MAMRNEYQQVKPKKNTFFDMQYETNQERKCMKNPGFVETNEKQWTALVNGHWSMINALRNSQKIWHENLFWEISPTHT
jgi:hypothetical protein